ncbi:MAG: endolytic transglycosylase MltG [Acidobacteria bacterium]|nr:MAG: endolytic transglycosylase MltG [Acidobacteriota bacterium]
MLRRLFILIVVIGILGAGGAWWVLQQFDVPYRGFTDTEIFVELPPGSSTADIAGRLSAMGVVRDPLLFRLAVRYAKADRHLQAGEYRFVDEASPNDVIARLRRGDTFNHAVTFPEGLTAREMGDVFERAGLGTADEFVQAAGERSLIADLDPRAKNLEGFLFPSTYSLPRHAGAPGFVRAMVKEFRKALGAEPLPDGMASVRDLVTLASIVEKETAAPEERPLVAAVYLNRLKIRMPLQCDPTVIYALMLRGRWNGNIRKTDLQIDSPYNTYRYPGLPPGPIASPGRASLDAVRHPADVKYLYFVSRNDGTHVFAATLAEHNRNVRLYQSRR